MSREYPTEERTLEAVEKGGRSQDAPPRIAAMMGGISARLQALGMESVKASAQAEQNLDQAGFYIVTSYMLGDLSDEQKLQAMVANTRREGRECQITRQDNVLKLWVR